MANTNKKLNKAASIRDDEFYTTKEDAQNIVGYYIDIIKQFKYVVCCADTANSEFVKALQTHGVQPDYFVDCNRVFAYDPQNTIIVTNPPFSICNVWIQSLINAQYRFVLLQPLTAFNRQATQHYIANGMCYCSHMKSYEFTNTNKKVHCFVLQNVKPVQNHYHAHFTDNNREMADTGIMCVNNLKSIDAAATMQYVPATYCYYNDLDQYEIHRVTQKVTVNGNEKFERLLLIKKTEVIVMLEKLLKEFQNEMLNRGFTHYVIEQMGVKSDRNGVYGFIQYTGGNRCTTVQNSIFKYYYKEV